MVPFIPNYLIYRYGTLLNSSEVHGGEAENSTNARKEVLNESLGLTLKHPVVGVGPGQFRVAAAAQSKDEGVRALWLETHNTYTQTLIAYIPNPTAGADAAPEDVQRFRSAIGVPDTIAPGIGAPSFFARWPIDSTSAPPADVPSTPMFFAGVVFCVAFSTVMTSSSAAGKT